jgi:hypothetical protein
MHLDDKPFTGITEGLIKAWGLLAQKKARDNGPPKRPKYTYEPLGSVIHLKRWLRGEDRQIMGQILDKVRNAPNPQLQAEFVKALPRHMIKFVAVKRAILNEHSRYSGEALREIRKKKGVGRPPKQTEELRDAAE